MIRQELTRKALRKNKAIEKVESYKIRTIGNALRKARTNYEEARVSYNQTGYDRYYNKMNRLEQEIEELEAYLEKDRINERLLNLKSELEGEKASYKMKLQEIKKDLMNRLFYLLKVIPECSEAKSLEAYINKLDD